MLELPEEYKSRSGVLQVHVLDTLLWVVEARQLDLCEPGADQLILPKYVQARAQCAWRWTVLESPGEYKSQLGVLQAHGFCTPL